MGVTRGPKLLKDGSVPESQIQREILLWLEKNTDYLSWRQSAGSLFLHGRKVNLGPIGVPDIVIIVPPNGRFLGLEVKSAHGAIRPEQKAFKAKLEASGGIYEIVRSLDQAQNAVAKAIGEEKCKQRRLLGLPLWEVPSSCRPN